LCRVDESTRIELIVSNCTKPINGSSNTRRHTAVSRAQTVGGFGMAEMVAAAHSSNWKVNARSLNE